MKKIVLFFVAVLISVAAFAQEESSFYYPDFKRLKKAVKSKKSDVYFPKLVERFIEVDTTMTWEHVFCLYYGAVTRSNFDPYGYFESQKNLDDLFAEQDWSKSDLEKGVQMVDKQLEKSPASLFFTLYKYRIYQRLYGVESEEVAKVASLVNKVLKVIFLTGNGRSMETACYVPYICDEYDILNIFGLRRTEQALVHEGKHSYDVLTLEENEYEIEKFYFDVTVMMDYMGKSFK